MKAEFLSDTNENGGVSNPTNTEYDPRIAMASLKHQFPIELPPTLDDGTSQLAITRSEWDQRNRNIKEAKRTPKNGRTDATEHKTKGSDHPSISEDWKDDANCFGVDPELFFPESGDNAETAKEVCRACVVRGECLEYALQNGERIGIWGGLGEKSRLRIRRQRAAAARAIRSA